MMKILKMLEIVWRHWRWRGDVRDGLKILEMVWRRGRIPLGLMYIHNMRDVV